MKRLALAVLAAWVGLLIALGKRAWLQIDRITTRGARW